VVDPRRINRQRDSWRSELIIRCIDDYLDGKHFSLELIRPSL
jgi:hypothetical protein